MEREESFPEETEAVLTAARDRTAVAASRRSSFGGPRPALNLGMSRLDKVKAEQQAKQLAWVETEREKLQEEVKTLRSLQVSCCGAPVLDARGRMQRARGMSGKCRQGFQLLMLCDLQCVENASVVVRLWA